jgi:hypothetical protein
MTKIINRPLTTIDNRDFMTGEYVKPQPVKEMVEHKAKLIKWVEQKQSEARADGKVFVDGLGWVTL